MVTKKKTAVKPGKNKMKLKKETLKDLTANAKGKDVRGGVTLQALGGCIVKKFCMVAPSLGG